MDRHGEIKLVVWAFTGLGLGVISGRMVSNIEKSAQKRIIVQRAAVLGLENPAKTRDNYEMISLANDYNGDGILDYLVKFKDGREEIFLGRGFERKDISGKVKWTDSDGDTVQLEE